MELRKEIELLTYECLDKAIELDIIKRPKTFKRNLIVRVINIGGCYGGAYEKKPRVTFGLKHPDIYGTNKFIEYKHIHKSKTIGSFESEHHLLPRMAVIAHELAHAIDYWNKDKGYGSHKDTWRHLYGQLRRNWVNELLE